MFFFGHLGIGSKIATPWSRRLPKIPLFLGTILPDLIDKPLYYGLSWWTGKSGADLGLIAGTRCFGHSALLLLTMTLGSVVFRLKWLAALSLGVATHLLLDNLGDRLLQGPEYTARALLWPFQGWQFPAYPFQGLVDHLSQVGNPYFLATESLGLAILFWDFWKFRQRREVAHWIIERRSAWRKSTRVRSRRGENF